MDEMSYFGNGVANVKSEKIKGVLSPAEKFN
jgi:hypothetical protein